MDDWTIRTYANWARLTAATYRWQQRVDRGRMPAPKSGYFYRGERGY